VHAVRDSAPTSGRTSAAATFLEFMTPLRVR
jgi:hypothetical protein